MDFGGNVTPSYAKVLEVIKKCKQENVDAAAEIEDHESGARGSLYGKYPSFAILNPELTYSINQKETAYGAMVTFAQLFSNYFGGSSKIAEEIFRVNYREAGAVIFPKWLRAVSKHYSDAVYNYAVNVMNVDTNGKHKIQVTEEGIAETESIYRQYGIAVTFNEIAEVPEVEVILEELKEFEDDDILTREEVKDMIMNCIKQ